MSEIGSETSFSGTSSEPSGELESMTDTVGDAKDRPPTPHEALIAAREIALETGLKYAYTGNVLDPWRRSTDCPGCGELVIGRDWHAITAYRLEGDRRGHCGHRIAGRFDEARGHRGRRRMPVRL
jgi:pyruvate formate lyase activating enzyme